MIIIQLEYIIDFILGYLIFGLMFFLAQTEETNLFKRIIFSVFWIFYLIVYVIWILRIAFLSSKWQEKSKDKEEK